jgi:hypothetical protein
MKTRKDFTTAVHNNESVKITDAGPNWDELVPLLEREFPELRWLDGNKPTEFDDFTDEPDIIISLHIHNRFGTCRTDTKHAAKHTTTAQEVIKMLKQNETAEKYKDKAIECESPEQANELVEVLGVEISKNWEYGNYGTYLCWCQSDSTWCFFGAKSTIEKRTNIIPASQVISDLSDKFIGDAFEHDGKWYQKRDVNTADLEFGEKCIVTKVKDGKSGWRPSEYCGKALNQKDGRYWIAGASDIRTYLHLAIQVAAPAKKVTKLTVSKAGNMMREAGLIEGELAIVEEA